MHKDVYLFDVDGTLTNSRSLIDPDFKEFFLNFIANHNVCIVTGSDYSKTLEQLGEDVMHNVMRSYQCSGNSIWENGLEVERNNWTLGNEERDFLSGELFRSKFLTRTGTHLDDRPGLVNFSVVGRGATTEQRAEYVAYDTEHKERKFIAELFNSRYGHKGVKAQVAGETGLDIIQEGRDKGQVIDDFDDYNVFFFGDMMQPGGNDEPLAKTIASRGNENDGSIWVKDWKHTWDILKDINNE
jgi:phosphomannomutase